MEKAPKPVKVKGLTTVSYDLVGRSDIVLEVPAYLCKGSGKVVVRVAVDRTGQVSKAELDQSFHHDRGRVYAGQCTFLRRWCPLFQLPTAAPQPQRGTITYIFLAQ